MGDIDEITRSLQQRAEELRAGVDELALVVNSRPHFPQLILDAFRDAKRAVEGSA